MYTNLWQFSPHLVDFFHIVVAVLVIILTFLALIFLKYAYRRQQISNNLPGPKYGFFNFTATLSELDTLIKESSHKHLNVAFLKLSSNLTKEYGKHGLFCTWFSYTPFVFFVRGQALEEILTFSKLLRKGWDYDYLHPWLGTGLLTSFGKKWKARRKLFSPSFHLEILKDFLPIFNENAQKLVKVLQKDSSKNEIDIVAPVTLCTLDIICETTLGIEINAQENGESEYVKAVLRVSSIITERMGTGNVVADFLFQFTKAGKQLSKDIKLLHEFTNRVIREKKQKLLSGDVAALTTKKRKALMDVLLEHHVATKQLSDEDIREEVDTFTFEGHDTTSMGISWAFYLIGLHKDVQEKLHEELDRIFGNDTERAVETDDLKEMTYLDIVLKECQRIYPSVPLITRQATEDVEICGYKIPKGTGCAIMSYEVHRDEKVFPDPEKFDPNRFLPENTIGRHPFAYIPFSAGPRNCIGQRFAIMEEKVIIATVLRHFTIESLDSRDEMIPVPEIILRSLNPIRMRIRPRRVR